MKNLILIIIALVTAFSIAQSKEDMIERKNPKTLYDSSQYGFTQTVNVPTDDEYIFISGQLGAKKEEHKFSTDFRTQVKNMLQNVIHALEANNVTTNEVVKITVLIKDHSEKRLGIFTEELLKTWGKKYPASTLIPVPKLALEGMLIEVDAIAYKAKKR